MNKFLDSLKKSLDTGEFNSEIAKKITDIDELAEKKVRDGLTASDLEENIKKRIEEGGIKTVTEEEAASINQDYEKKMDGIRKADAINREIATLTDIEVAVLLSVVDMFEHIEELESRYDTPEYLELAGQTTLFPKIKEIKEKFKSIIN